MEWLLVFYFNTSHGSVSTDRIKTYEECQSIGTTIKNDTAVLSIAKFKCIEVKKLDIGR